MIDLLVTPAHLAEAIRIHQQEPDSRPNRDHYCVLAVAAKDNSEIRFRSAQIGHITETDKDHQSSYLKGVDEISQTLLEEVAILFDDEEFKRLEQLLPLTIPLKRHTAAVPRSY